MVKRSSEVIDSCCLCRNGPLTTRLLSTARSMFAAFTTFSLWINTFKKQHLQNKPSMCQRQVVTN